MTGIVGDHGQTEWRGQTPQQVALDQILAEFKLADTAVGFHADEELIVCPNMRAAAVYLSRHCSFSRDYIAKTILQHDGVDQAIYREDRTDGSTMLTVRTRDRGRLTFARESSDLAHSGSQVRDAYGNLWCVFGELTALDLSVDEDGQLTDGVYPNPLERIAGAFPPGSNPIWLTASPKAEFKIAESSSHASGSHGSLHRDDSVAALLTTSDADLSHLPDRATPRIVDVMDVCLASLGRARRPHRNDESSSSVDTKNTSSETITQ